MAAFRIFSRLVIYYTAIALVVTILAWAFPKAGEYLPVGRVQSLVAQAGGAVGRGQAGLKVAHLSSLGESLVWMVSAVVGALLVALPVAWVYMAVRDPENYDQSLVDTIVVLPIVVTSIVVIVQDSLALSFSLAGIAGAARFRTSMKSSGDLLFVLLATGIGLAAGIGAMELAFVTTVVFNLAFLTLWAIEFGERADMKRYLGDFRPGHPGDELVVKSVSATVEEVTVSTVPSHQGG